VKLVIAAGIIYNKRTSSTYRSRDREQRRPSGWPRLQETAYSKNIFHKTTVI